MYWRPDTKIADSIYISGWRNSHLVSITFLAVGPPPLSLLSPSIHSYPCTHLYISTEGKGWVWPMLTLRILENVQMCPVWWVSANYVIVFCVLCVCVCVRRSSSPPPSSTSRRVYYQCYHRQLKRRRSFRIRSFSGTHSLEVIDSNHVLELMYSLASVGFIH